MPGTKLKIALIVLAVLIVCGVIFLPGYTKYQELKLRSDNLKVEVDRLRVENTQLQQKIKRIKTDPDYIEELARQELGLAKAGEVVYKVKRIPPEKSE